MAGETVIKDFFTSDLKYTIILIFLIPLVAFLAPGIAILAKYLIHIAAIVSLVIMFGLAFTMGGGIGNFLIGVGIATFSVLCAGVYYFSNKLDWEAIINHIGRLIGALLSGA